MSDHPQRAVWPPCDVCGLPVESSSSGVLSINTRAIDAPAGPLFQSGGPNLRLVTVLDAETVATGTCWNWAHAGCASETDNFQISASGIETSARALEWTLRLLDEEWFSATNWSETMRRFRLNDRRLNRG